MTVTIFQCNRGGVKANTVKVQLEIPAETLEAYKKKAEGTNYTPKQVMENMLRNWIDGIAANVE